MSIFLREFYNSPQFALNFREKTRGEMAKKYDTRRSVVISQRTHAGNGSEKIHVTRQGFSGLQHKYTHTLTREKNEERRGPP